MEMYLPYAIAPSFALGSYGSYDSLMSALRRFYGEDECQEGNLRQEMDFVSEPELQVKFMLRPKSPPVFVGCVSGVLLEGDGEVLLQDEEDDHHHLDGRLHTPTDAVANLQQ